MFDNRPPTPWRDEPDPWRDPALERTQPIAVAPPTPPLPPRRKRGMDGLALILIGALVGGAVGIGGARALTPQLFPASALTTPARGSTAATDPAAQAAVTSVIRQANAAQATAFAKNDPAAMQATSTASHNAEMGPVKS